MPRGYFPGAPDLAVEVGSPDDTVFEVEEEVAEWLEAGSLAVWVVNPKQRTLTIHSRDGLRVFNVNDQLDGEPAVPGFALAVAEIFD